MTEPTRVLAEGTIRYQGSLDGSATVDWMTARVFVLDYRPSDGWNGQSYVTVVAREPMYLPGYRVPAAVGSIHSLPANDPSDFEGEWEGEGTLLTLDVDALVPA